VRGEKTGKTPLLLKESGEKKNQEEGNLGEGLAAFLVEHLGYPAIICLLATRDLATSFNGVISITEHVFVFLLKLKILPVF
jgi:hypothetical protein